MRSLLAGLMAVLLLAQGAEAQPAKAQARAVYAKGKAAYERGEYAEALAHFERAHRLSSAPALLFNMAQAHRLSGPDHCQQALDLYRRYLSEDPKASNREEAAERIEEMQACVSRAHEAESADPSPRAPEPTPARVPDPPKAQSRPADRPREAGVAASPLGQSSPPERARPTAAIIVAGAGAALGVAGVILYARARAKYDEAERSCPCPAGSFSNWETLTTVSYGLMAAGAVGTAGGVSWYLLGGETGAPRGLLISGTGRF